MSADGKVPQYAVDPAPLEQSTVARLTGIMAELEHARVKLEGRLAVVRGAQPCEAPEHIDPGCIMDALCVLDAKLSTVHQMLDELGEFL